MRIRRLEVINFRALRNSSINFQETTALLGENNSGKSAFLLAIDLFFSSSPRLSDADYSDRNVKEPIDITLHFTDLTPREREEFEGNLIDGALVITRRFAFSSEDNGKYFVSARVNPDFSECRATTGKTEKRNVYTSLRDKYGNPPELQKEKNADEIDGFLEAWEAKNPDKLSVQKVAAFKGWTNVAAGKLKQKTSYHFIRAVQDAAADIQESKGSPVKSLIDAIARQTIENSADFKAFLEEANKKISTITDPKNVPLLSEISGELTGILSDYYKHSELITAWSPITSIQPSFPTANIDVKDNGFVTGLNGVGHGLQRAIILTVLRFMANHRAKTESSGEDFDEAQSDLILAIEEPEIYQHPTKQRLFAKLLSSLSRGFSKSTGIRVQIIFVTHSPLMISIADCGGIRMIRSVAKNESKNVEVTSISLLECSRRSADVAGLPKDKAWSEGQYAAKLHTFGPELAEGFFSKVVVLVEGVGDKSVLDAWYKICGRDPHAEGIVIVEVSGKNNLTNPVIIFSGFEIPCYWIFDNDKSNEKKKKDDRIKANKILQRLAGVDAAKCADWPDGRFESFASWDCKLERYVSDKIGEEKFSAICAKHAAYFDIENDMCLKFPASAAALLSELVKQGVEFDELDEIISHVDLKLASAN
jgi:predicted ATP-dependent endonuclease of OLD family